MYEFLHTILELYALAFMFYYAVSAVDKKVFCVK